MRKKKKQDLPAREPSEVQRRAWGTPRNLTRQYDPEKEQGPLRPRARTWVARSGTEDSRARRTKCGLKLERLPGFPSGGITKGKLVF